MSRLTDQQQQELIAFTQQLVRTRSYTSEEESIIRLVADRMDKLRFDEVRIDAMGNVLGRIGSGGKSMLFDSHVDTVQVTDEAEWEHPPFGGEIIDGYLWGRGSVDMKSSVAATIYAAAWAKQLGALRDKTIYVSCTVMEEDCDGENLKHLFKEFQLRPDFALIAEPSNNRIALGHKGKLQAVITTHGVAAHGSAPEKGLNAIYEMSEIIQRVEQRNHELSQDGPMRGTMVMSNISSVSASLNAVPSECQAYLDRRLVPGETEDALSAEMDSLIRGKRATWQLGTLHRKSWTGQDVVYQPFHLAWKMEEQHALTRACVQAYRSHFLQKPDGFEFWDFSTNAVTPVSMDIPTIGFGPGDYKLAHMRNERCAVQQIIDACGFYQELMEVI